MGFESEPHLRSHRSRTGSAEPVYRETRPCIRFPMALLAGRGVKSGGPTHPIRHQHRLHSRLSFFYHYEHPVIHHHEQVAIRWPSSGSVIHPHLMAPKPMPEICLLKTSILPTSLSRNSVATDPRRIGKGCALGLRRFPPASVPMHRLPVHGKGTPSEAVDIPFSGHDGVPPPHDMPS